MPRGAGYASMIARELMEAKLPPGHRADTRRRGRGFQLSSAGDHGELYVEGESHVIPVQRTIRIQTTGAIDITITEMTDGATFVRPFPGGPPLTIPAGPIRRVASFAANVSITAKLHAAVTSATVNMQAHDGSLDILADLLSQVFTLSVTGATSTQQVVANGSGVIRSYTATAKLLTAAAYPMFLDLPSSSAPVSGTTLPIPGSVGALMSTGGTQDQFQDTLNSMILTYATGLVFALSTTPDVWTNVGGGTFTGHVEIGQ